MSVLDGAASEQACLALLVDMKSHAAALVDIASRPAGCGAMGDAHEEVLAMRAALAAGRLLDAAQELQSTLRRIAEAWLFGDIPRLVRHRSAREARLRQGVPRVEGRGQGDLAEALAYRDSRTVPILTRPCDDAGAHAGTRLDPAFLLDVARKRKRKRADAEVDGDGAPTPEADCEAMSARWTEPLHTADAETASLVAHVADLVDGGGVKAATAVSESLHTLRACVQRVCAGLPDRSVPFRVNGVKALEVVHAASRMRQDALKRPSGGAPTALGTP